MATLKKTDELHSNFSIQSIEDKLKSFKLGAISVFFSEVNNNKKSMGISYEFQLHNFDYSYCFALSYNPHLGFFFSHPLFLSGGRVIPRVQEKFYNISSRILSLDFLLNTLPLNLNYILEVYSPNVYLKAKNGTLSLLPIYNQKSIDLPQFFKFNSNISSLPLKNQLQFIEFDWTNIFYLKKITEEHINKAIKNNPFSIQFIDSPSFESCCLALSEDPLVLPLIPKKHHEKLKEKGLFFNL